MIATKAEAANFQYGNSQLIMEYRKVMIKAYDLGEEIKKVYGILPPKVLHDKVWDIPLDIKGIKANHITIGLAVN